MVEMIRGLITGGDGGVMVGVGVIDGEDETSLIHPHKTVDPSTTPILDRRS